MPICLYLCDNFSLHTSDELQISMVNLYFVLNSVQDCQGCHRNKQSKWRENEKVQNHLKQCYLHEHSEQKLHEVLRS